MYSSRAPFAVGASRSFSSFYRIKLEARVCIRCTIYGGPVCFSYVRTSALKSLGTSVIFAWEVEKLHDTLD